MVEVMILILILFIGTLLFVWLAVAFWFLSRSRL